MRVTDWALASNAVTLNAAFETTQPLIEAGIPVVFIKGAAMIAAAGGRLGLRRIVDVDVIVPEADAQRAVTALTAAGYQGECPAGLPPAFVLHHAWTCIAPNESELDLHWWAYKRPATTDACSKQPDRQHCSGVPCLFRPRRRCW